jgi:hypothetical protein
VLTWPSLLASVGTANRSRLSRILGDRHRVGADSHVGAHNIGDGARSDSLPVAENSASTPTIWVRNLAVENGALASCSLASIGGNDGGWTGESWREW